MSSVVIRPEKKAIFHIDGRVQFAKDFVDDVANPSRFIYGALTKMSKWTTELTISGISQSNPAVVTSISHGLNNGDYVTIADVIGMVEINGIGSLPIKIGNVTTDTFQLLGIDSSSYSTYESGGIIIIDLENSWPYPKQTIKESDDVRNETFALKRVAGSNICLVIPRYDWKKMTYYASADYTDDQLMNKAFYVVNSQNSVYKCIWNNNGSVSTSEPLSRSLGRFTLPDGYIWKYMYTIGTDDSLLFENNEWIPVRQIDYDNSSDQWKIQKAAVPGTIDAIGILNGGKNYTETMTVTIEGDGIGATAQINGNASLNSDGRILSIEVTNPGYGYTWAIATINHPSGTGARTRVLISPRKGHGADPIHELFATRVLINLPFHGGENDSFMIDGMFRRMAIWRSPETKTGLKITTNTIDTRHVAIFSNITNKNPSSNAFEIGQVIVGNESNASAIISSNVNLGQTTICELIGNFKMGETVESVTGTATIDSVSPPNFNMNSGTILYVENRSGSYRMGNSSESLKTILDF